MHIKVKGVSGHLVFVLDDSQEFNNLIKELEGLLDSPLFKSNGFYPKAFFDFKSQYTYFFVSFRICSFCLRKLLLSVYLFQKLHYDYIFVIFKRCIIWDSQIRISI